MINRLRTHWPLGVVLGVGAAVFGAGLRRPTSQPYYAVAAHSMSQSWRAFWFGTIDRRGAVTIDKIPGFLWPQALSARLFGFHPWALVLPVILEGLACVVGVYLLCYRLAGRWAATLAAATFLLTPIVASAYGNTMEDGLLVTCVVWAMVCWQAAVRSGSRLALVGVGIFLGLGFQAKMAQAWLALVPIGFATLACWAVPLRRRALALSTMVGATLAASAPWVITVLAVGRSSLFVDGTTNNSVLSMVFGYNGLDRFGFTTAGAIFQPVPSNEHGQGPGKLFSPGLYSQFGWLLPLALGCAVPLLRAGYRRRRAPGDSTWPIVSMWVSWLVVTGAVMSFGHLAHTAYLLSLAPPLAVLIGAGAPALLAEYAAGSRLSWLLAGAVGATVLGTVIVQAHFAGFLPQLTVAVAAVGTAVTALLVAAPALGRWRWLAPAALLSLFLVPAAWSVSVWSAHNDGSASDASAGPGGLPGYRPYADRAQTPDASLDRTAAQDRALFGFIQATTPGVRFPLIADNWTTTVNYMLDTPGEALPVGGYTGRAPTLSTSELRRLIAEREARYVLLRPAAAEQSTVGIGLSNYVHSACAAILPIAQTPRLTAERVTLYDCWSRPRPHDGRRRGVGHSVPRHRRARF